MNRVFVLISLLGLAGCSLGPVWQPPKVDMPGNWGRKTVSTTLPMPSVARNPRWFEGFGDPVLSAFVRESALTNPSLQAAEARVRGARAQAAAAGASLLPALNGSVGTKSYQDATWAVMPGQDRQNDLFRTGFDASWEIDVFGANRKGREAALAAVDSAQASLADARLSLAADVVATYVRFRVAEAREALAISNTAAQRESLNVVEARAKAGVSSGLELAQAQTLLATTEASLPLWRAQKDNARATLAFLLGRASPAFEVSSGLSVVSLTLPPIGAGVPSELLTRRPDIAASGAAYRAAVARVGQAEALRFPKFSLTAAAGLQSLELTQFLQGSNGFWNVAPVVSVPLFNGGLLKAQVDARKAEMVAAEAQYRQVVLGALKDVDAGLTAFAEQQKRVAKLEKAQVSARKTLALARKLYVAGEQDFLPVLDAERTLLSVEDSLAEARGQAVLLWVSLVKALGGGFDGVSLAAPISGLEV